MNLIAVIIISVSTIFGAVKFKHFKEDQKEKDKIEQSE